MKFSIITPSLNQPDWLRLCVASVADQVETGVAVEHIVQDAGSGAAVESLARERHDSLHLFVEKDAGMYDAVNRGLRRATGDICAYLNCDEQYLPGALAQVAAFFQANPTVDVVFADALLIDAAGNPISYRRAVLPQVLHTRLAHLGTLTCATFFRRALIERKLIFPEEWKVIGDGLWVLQLLKAKVRMAVLPKPLAVFTFTDNNLGQGQRAIAEGEAWRRSLGWQVALRPWAILYHRWRKLWHGAYRWRLVTADLYTATAPGQRIRSRARLGWRWPKG